MIQGVRGSNPLSSTTSAGQRPRRDPEHRSRTWPSAVFGSSLAITAMHECCAHERVGALRLRSTRPLSACPGGASPGFTLAVSRAGPDVSVRPTGAPSVHAYQPSDIREAHPGAGVGRDRDAPHRRAPCQPGWRRTRPRRPGAVARAQRRSLAGRAMSSRRARPHLGTVVEFELYPQPAPTKPPSAPRSQVRLAVAGGLVAAAVAVGVGVLGPAGPTGDLSVPPVYVVGPPADTCALTPSDGIACREPLACATPGRSSVTVAVPIPAWRAVSASFPTPHRPSGG